MSTEPAIASGYRSYSPTSLPNNAPAYRRPLITPIPREDAPVPTSTTLWPNLPERCFGADCELPAWLLKPWYALQDAAERRRPLATRLADLTRVAQALDDIFAVHLPGEQAWFDRKDAVRFSVTEHIPQWVDEVIAEATRVFMHQLRPELVAEGIYVRSVAQLDEWQREWLQDHFMQRIYPLLTPLAVDPGRPFPYISSDSLNLLVEIYGSEGVRAGNVMDRNCLFARVKVPRATPRLVAVPSQQSSGFAPKIFVGSADLVRYFVHRLFANVPVRNVYLFRVVRGEQPLPGVCAGAATRVRRQDDMPVVRLDVEQRMGLPVLDWLIEHLRLPRYALAQHDRLLDWSCLPELAARVGARPGN